MIWVKFNSLFVHLTNQFKFFKLTWSYDTANPKPGLII